MYSVIYLEYIEYNSIQLWNKRILGDVTGRISVSMFTLVHVTLIYTMLYVLCGNITLLFIWTFYRNNSQLIRLNLRLSDVCSHIVYSLTIFSVNQTVNTLCFLCKILVHMTLYVCQLTIHLLYVL